VDERIRLGKYTSSRARWELTPDEWRTATHIVGAPGWGKSTIMGNAVEMSATLGESLLVLDIKGDLVQRIAASTAYPERVVYFAPGRAFARGRVWGYNLLDFDPADTIRSEKVAQEIPQVIERLGMARLAEMQNISTILTQLTRLALGTEDPTLLDLYLMLYSPPYLVAMLKASGYRPSRAFFGMLARLVPNTRQGVWLTTATRLGHLLDPPIMALTLSQPRSTFTLERFLSEGKIILCDLGDGLSRAQGIEFGNLIMAEFIALAYARPLDERDRTYRVAVDEFHLFVGKVFGEIIAQARSYNCFPILAQQGLHQLGDGDARAARAFKGDLDLAGVQIYFATSAEDRLALAGAHGLRWADTLRDQELHHAKVRWQSGPTRRRREADIIGDDWHRPDVPGQLDAVRDRAMREDTIPLDDAQRYLDRRYWRWLPPIDYAKLLDNTPMRTDYDDTTRRHIQEQAEEDQAQGAGGQPPSPAAPAPASPPRESLRFGPDPAGTPGAGGPVPLRDVDQSADILSPFPRRRGTGRSRTRE